MSKSIICNTELEIPSNKKSVDSIESKDNKIVICWRKISMPACFIFVFSGTHYNHPSWNSTKIMCNITTASTISDKSDNI